MCKMKLLDQDIFFVVFLILFMNTVGINICEEDAEGLTQSDCTPISATKTKSVKSDKRVQREVGSKKLLVGGYQPADVNSDDVKRLADFSTLELAKQINGGNSIQLVKIVKAETQVVAGINMRMKLQFKNTDTNELQQCEVVIYEKSWENVRELTSFNCKKMSDKRVRREGGSKKLLVGGYQPADVNSDDVKRLANFSTLELAKQINGGNSIQLVKIVKAATQVVAGINMRLKLQFKNTATNELQQCDVVIYEKSWENVRELTSFNCKKMVGKRVRREKEVNKRALGGYKPADVNSDAVQRLANFSTLELAKQVNCRNCIKLDKVIKAESQVVAGINMRMTLQLKNTGTNEFQECNVVVYERAWENIRELKSFSCNKMVGKRVRREKEINKRAVGGYKPADVNSDVVQRLANFSTLELAKQVNCKNCIKLDKVIKAESQTVGGIKVRMNLQLKNTDTNEFQRCNVVVYERAWENFRELSSFNCSKLADKKVHEQGSQPVVGGYQPADVNSDVVQRLANFSTLKLANRVNCKNCIQLDKVIKAESQVVNGLKVHIILQLKNSDTNEILQCDAVVLEKAWKKLRQLQSLTCNTVSRNQLN